MKTFLAVIIVLCLILIVWIPKSHAGHRIKTKSKTVTTYRSDGSTVVSSSSRTLAPGYYVKAPSYRVQSSRVRSSCPGGNCPATSSSRSSQSRSYSVTKWKTSSRSR